MNDACSIECDEYSEKASNAFADVRRCFFSAFLRSRFGVLIKYPFSSWVRRGLHSNLLYDTTRCS